MQDLLVDSVDSTGVMLTWNEPGCRLKGGIGYGYEIRFTVVNGDVRIIYMYIMEYQSIKSFVNE